MNQISSQASLNAKIKSICDVMRRSNATGALQYVPILSWLLFLRVLDEREESEQNKAEAIRVPFTPSLSYPYRWQDWASPTGRKRLELQNGVAGDVFKFVDKDLLPYLKSLKNNSNATSRQKIISEIVSSIESAGLDTERNFLDVIDKIDEIHQEGVDETHIFTLSQVYEGLLLKMGEKNNDGGQFFTPREVIRAIVKVVDPKIGETIYDPAAGTGGFLAQAHQHIKDELGATAVAEQMDQLEKSTFFGREKEKLIYPITLANLVLHGIEEPHIWHGNTLTKNETYGGLFTDAPQQFNVVLMNPPFGGKENDDAKTNYAYKTISTQVLFLQEIIDSLAPEGRAGIVVDDGLLSRTTERAFVKTKRKLIEECDLWCIVNLPSGVFIQAGTSNTKTNLLFFNKGNSTEKVWYYDLSDIKVNKRNPLTLAHFDHFFKLLPTRADSPKSWTVTLQQIEENNYDLKAVNPNRVEDTDTRTPTELLDLIEQKTQTIQTTLAKLRQNP